MEFVLGEATVSIRVRSMRMHGFLMRVFQSKRFYLVFCLTVSLFFSSISSATYYYWTGNAVYTGSVDPTPYGACKKAWDLIIAGGLGYSPNYSSVNAVRFDDADYGCYIYYTSAAGVLYGGGEVGAELEGTECPPNQSLDVEAGVCRYNYSPKQKGASHELACNIVKDPINFSNGNVFETEVKQCC
jgi:hypothetical protein